MSNTIYKNLSLPVSGDRLVYFNGVEIPTERVEVSFGVWRFPEISIDVPADPLLHRLGADDKIQVSVFYLDSWYDSAKPTFRLLAEGEIVSWSYIRTGNSRIIRFSAVNQMAILTQLFTFFIADIDTALGTTQRAKKLQSRGNAATLPVLPIGFFYRELQQKEFIKRPIDFLLNMLCSITGFISGEAVFSKTKDFNALLGKARSEVQLASKITGSNIVTEATNLIGSKESRVVTDAGPTQFSNSGLIASICKKLNIPIDKAITPQDIYTYISGKGLTGPSELIKNTAGGLFFESETSDSSKITHVGISLGNGKTVEVISTKRTSSGGDGFFKVMEYVSRHETPGGMGYSVLVEDKTLSGKSAGAAFGFVQFNQSAGNLGRLLTKMNAKDSTRFANLFGAGNVEILTNEKEFRRLNIFRQDDFSVSFRQNLIASGKDPIFQQAQLEFAKELIFDPAVSIANSHNLSSERAIIFMADFVTQWGSRRARQETAKAVSALGTVYSEKALLRELQKFADAGQRFKRRLRILLDKKLSDTNPPASADEETNPGVVSANFSTSWRKFVEFGLLPGVDYGKITPPNSTAVRKVKEDKGVRLRIIEKEKTDAVSALKKKNSSLTTSQAEQIFFKSNAGKSWARRKKDAENRARDAQLLRRNMSQSLPALHFFQRWLKLTKLKDKIVACPTLEDRDVTRKGIFPILEALNQENAARALIQYGQATSGDGGSLWSLVQKIFSIMFYEVDMITAPPCVITDADHVITDLCDLKEETDQEKINAAADADIAKGRHLRLGSYITKPNMYFGLPPSCNVYFPSMIESFQMEENYATQPTRIYINDDTTVQQFRLGNKGGPGALLYYLNTKAGYPPSVDAALHDPKLKANTKNLMIFPVEYYKGPVVDRRQSPSWFSYLFRETRNNSQITEPVINPTNVVISGNKVTINAAGKKTTLEYINDTAVANPSSTIFLQNGYLRGKPIRFKAKKIDGNILHELAAKDFLALRAEAAKKKVTLKIKSAYRSLSEQAAQNVKARTADAVGFSARHYGAEIELQINSRVRRFLKTTALNFRFTYRADSNSIVHNFVSDSVFVSDTDRDLTNILQNKKKPKFKDVITPLPTVIGASVYGKASQFSGQRTGQHQFYHAYATYEFFREKFSSRVGQLDGVFNPYLIHGFPAYILDEPSYNYHTIGYVIGGRHVLEANGNTTMAQISNIRTFNEMFELITAEGNGYPVGPLDPVREVRDLTQRTANARDFYKKLLYGNRSTTKDPLGDYTKLLAWANTNGPPVPIIADAGEKGYNMRYNTELDILPAAQNLFDNTEAALNYVSRPVCTLEEYITFYRGIRTKERLPGDNIIRDSSTEPTFYSQIRNLAYGGGVNLDPSADNISQTERQKRLRDLPPTIRDWQSVLLAYRRKTYDGKPK